MDDHVPTWRHILMRASRNSLKVWEHRRALFIMIAAILLSGAGYV